MNIHIAKNSNPYWKILKRHIFKNIEIPSKHFTESIEYYKSCFSSPVEAIVFTFVSLYASASAAFAPEYQ